MTERRQPPNKRRSVNVKFKAHGTSFFLTIGFYEDGSMCEIFVDAARTGSELRDFMNALALTISLGLQHGVPPEEFIEALNKFAPRSAQNGIASALAECLRDQGSIPVAAIMPQQEHEPVVKVACRGVSKYRSQGTQP